MLKTVFTFEHQLHKSTFLNHQPWVSEVFSLFFFLLITEQQALHRTVVCGVESELLIVVNVFIVVSLFTEILWRRNQEPLPYKERKGG